MGPLAVCVYGADKSPDPLRYTMLKLHLDDLLSICYTANFATNTVTNRTDGA